MINLRNDYSQIAHPQIMKVLSDACLNVNEGYGLDESSQRAAHVIRELLEDKSADIHFLMNGTGTNKTVLSHILRPYQAVISCDTGHINVHETGAVEATGHKVIVCNGIDGKLDRKLVEQAFYDHTDVVSEVEFNELFKEAKMFIGYISAKIKKEYPDYGGIAEND